MRRILGRPASFAIGAADFGLLRCTYYRSVINRYWRNARAGFKFSIKGRRGGLVPVMLENLIPLVLVSAIVFGVLWLVIEASAMLGNRKS
jgi:hypothetical protein